MLRGLDQLIQSETGIDVMWPRTRWTAWPRAQVLCWIMWMSCMTFWTPTAATCNTGKAHTCGKRLFLRSVCADFRCKQRFCADGRAVRAFFWHPPETGGYSLEGFFFDTWKFKILIGIAVFLVGIMAYAGANDRLTAAPQELLSVV